MLARGWDVTTTTQAAEEGGESLVAARYLAVTVSNGDN